MRYNNLEKFLKSIEEGKLCTGCCITFTDPAVTEIAAEAGFDFCWIDGEHGEMDRNIRIVICLKVVIAEETAFVSFRRNGANGCFFIEIGFSLHSYPLLFTKSGNHLHEA